MFVDLCFGNFVPVSVPGASHIVILTKQIDDF